MNLTQCCSNLNKSFFFFNDTATTEIYTLSLHDALPIFVSDDPVVGHPPDNRSADARSLPPSDPCRALSPASAGHPSQQADARQRWSGSYGFAGRGVRGHFGSWRHHAEPERPTS